MNGKLVYLGIGSNIGDKYQNLLNSIQLICQSNHIEIVNCSSIYQSSSWGFVSDDFYNMVISIQTTLSPIQLLNFLKAIEIKLGRTLKTIENKFQARIIDLDILLFQGTQLETEELILPHKEILNRSFVLKPLLELDASILLKNNILQETVDMVKNQSEIQLLKDESKKLKNELFQ
jgi:2-amino-4-hydroxy-6-hydroxymethyldihydropteridine diphosphokinase